MTLEEKAEAWRPVKQVEFGKCSAWGSKGFITCRYISVSPSFQSWAFSNNSFSSEFWARLLGWIIIDDEKYEKCNGIKILLPRPPSLYQTPFYMLWTYLFKSGTIYSMQLHRWEKWSWERPIRRTWVIVKCAFFRSMILGNISKQFP